MRRISAILVLLVAGALALGAQSAAADVPIEGVWSFNGGEVGIQVQPGGTLVGTVVAPTKFSQCFHPAGEQMWTQMRLQPDGSYWGLHQWYFATEACEPNPALGLTAWRVLSGEGGARFLRVCFSEPGSSSQPQISAAGVASDATFGCVDSTRISSLPSLSKAQLSSYLTLPANGACFGRSKLKVRFQDPPSDPFQKVAVSLRSGKVHRAAKVRRQGASVLATLSLKGLTASKFTVKVQATTVLGEQLSRKRAYRRCGAPPRHHRRSR
jgi:hypothetical protein